MEWFEETLHENWRQGIRIKEILYRDQTELQDLMIFESYAWGRVLTLDGVVQTTTGDEFCYHEMIVHVPMLAHGAPRQVLIIGGGDGGCLREALKHEGVERVTQVEIDRSVIDLCRKWLPTISDGAFDHPKARVIIADGARFAAESPERFDVIVVDSTDPIGPGAVLFTEEFYRNVRRLLNPGGILATQCGNPSIKPQELVDTQAAQRAAGFALVDYYLPVVPTYIGGGMALGFATDDPAKRKVGADAIRERGVPKGLRYYTPEVHVAAFAHPAWMIERVGH
ncbi:polyamine aminopropyltransferase [Benzoatithermus flavus]|uniref:Polyamine aminopropyltransferase n=1 Tax=Benzoatithermus flavus TaxID=3108223 RepID=A0ABU8XLB1_9PROT